MATPSDELIWGVINHKGNCSFRAKLGEEKFFCRNEHNVTGLCTRQSCPLANQRYATVKEIDGICYLLVKTIERAHTPNKLWEKIQLPKNYTKALGTYCSSRRVLFAFSHFFSTERKFSGFGC